MYDLQFFATDDADWAQAVELIDADTNGALADAATATFELQVHEHGCGPVLSASTAAGTITMPDSTTIQWRFTQAQMSALDISVTYKVGCRMTTDAGTIQLFTGSLALVGGGFS
jgi:hypothetical protein